MPAETDARTVKIPISKPQIGDAEVRAALDVLRSGQLVSGRRVAEFEAAVARYQGAQFGIATSNGSSALVVALLAHGIGPNDEVIVPAFTFFATASSVIAVGATPVFADIDPKTFNLSPDSLRRAISDQTRAVIPVHLFGQLAAMDAIAELTHSAGLALIEDAAQAMGAETPSGQRAGAWGSACLSFHPSKNMTTTEGGMIVTSDPKVAERARQIRNQGRGKDGQHMLVGSNYRLTELCAAIGLEQLKRLPGFERARQANAAQLDESLPSVQRPYRLPGSRHVFQQYTVRTSHRDQLLKRLHTAGVDARIYYKRPLHLEPAFAQTARAGDDLSEAERAALEVLSLPVHPAVTSKQLALISQLVAEE